MTKGPWKYQKAEGHHHVILGDSGEVLDVAKASDAKAIALLPEMLVIIKEMCLYRTMFEDTVGKCSDILKRLK